ncbi:peptidoglycan DD-metalloendopeptidase family protein [Candidatus Peregrinibacteria bacterium]|nr:peptidoglycan DD-metalloendopeptidase family protein [Candidatus Peregrinibacteria bacterium]
MFAKKTFFFCLLAALAACATEDNSNINSSEPTYESAEGDGDFGGFGNDFKVPLPPGYNWEVSQSWAEHCDICNEKGYDKVLGDYCDLSHSNGCYDVCKYGWDFNLPGNSDEGKPVLASADGTVIKAGSDGTWGNVVVIDHGSNICSRYAHLLDNSITVSQGKSVCQGLQIAKIGASGNAQGPHLHFQFENCGTKAPLKMGFTDGNDVPMCTIGNDVFNSQKQYSFLKLTNTLKTSCSSSSGGGSVSAKPWVNSACGALPDCPLIPSCGKPLGHKFSDDSSLTSDLRDAAAYLYSECALDGKADKGLHPDDKITRAEALKVSIFLFGLAANCGSYEPFKDVQDTDWFFSSVVCGVKYSIVSNKYLYFAPNKEATFGMAAKMIVESASALGVVEIKEPKGGHFKNVPSSHWAFKYLETLYLYGGIPSSMLSYNAEQKVTRGQVVLMAASLSPCFCKNVACGSSCVCDQHAFACVDPSKKSTGDKQTCNQSTDVGGYAEGVEEDAPSSDGSDQTGSSGDQGSSSGKSSSSGDQSGNSSNNTDSSSSDGKDKKDQPSSPSIVSNIDCKVIPEDTKCPVPGTVLFGIKCWVGNAQIFPIKFNTMKAYMIDPMDASSCIFAQDNYQSGVGIQLIPPFEKIKVGGNFYLSCSSMPKDGAIEVAYTMTEIIDGKKVTSQKAVATGVILLPQQSYDSCKLDCTPKCSGKQCGLDGCGGLCGQCTSSDKCIDGKCVSGCVPNCNAKQCGTDGCGGSCGICEIYSFCQESIGKCMKGTCQAYCPGKCEGGKCSIPEWKCNPKTTYEISFSIFGPTAFSILKNGGAPMGPIEYNGPGTFVFGFKCSDFPAAMKIQNKGGIKFEVNQSTYPPVAVWIPYDGFVTNSLPSPPDVSVYSFANKGPISFLIRIPAIPSLQ